ncbi:MAG: 2Fe-2S iron-sulfur cluster-binding protein [Halobacteriales archaeon]
MAEHTVEFASTGETIQVAETETVLRACLREGIAQEYSCRVGMCLACCAEVLEGEVVQPAAHALTEAERERFALTCMARPRSDLVLDRGVYPPSIEADAQASNPAPADD